MRLRKIVKLLDPDHAALDIPDVCINGLTHDSRKVRSGDLFVALPGYRQDGTQFVEDALRRGAAAIVGEKPLTLNQVPYVCVPDARKALADIAGLVFGIPADRLSMYGITGTNGKTTTAFMLRSVLQQAGRRACLISTVRYEIGDRNLPASHTTPEAPELHNLLQKMERAGCDSVVMEVSSHALSQQRVRGIDYDVAIFTNLTCDHLDFHGSMDAYFESKQRLFLELGRGKKHAVAVINRDDACADKLMQAVDAKRVNCITYGVHRQADVVAENVSLDIHGTRFTVSTPWGPSAIRLPLMGRFNVHNALAAIAAAGSTGISLDVIAQALQHMPDVPGRLQIVQSKKPFQVYVDYAHTPDALEQVLSVLKEMSTGRLLVVFGCGGDRDRSKRPAMAATSERLADYTIITSDNPRSENPVHIAEEVAAGFVHADRYTICIDRSEAIRQAVESARPGDTVLIAGKGHEAYQEIGQTRVPFDDLEVAWRFLNA